MDFVQVKLTEEELMEKLKESSLRRKSLETEIIKQTEEFDQQIPSTTSSETTTTKEENENQETTKVEAIEKNPMNEKEGEITSSEETLVSSIVSTSSSTLTASGKILLTRNQVFNVVHVVLIVCYAIICGL